MENYKVAYIITAYFGDDEYEHSTLEGVYNNLDQASRHLEAFTEKMKLDAKTECPEDLKDFDWDKASSYDKDKIDRYIRYECIRDTGLQFSHCNIRTFEIRDKFDKSYLE